MTGVRLLEHEVKKLNSAGLAAFRKWFHEFDAEAWDRQMERDVRSGKLDRLSRQALREYKAGKTIEI